MRTNPREDLSWAAETLRRQAMPAEEIRQVLTASDPVTVRRHLELHRERLFEQLAEQQRAVTSIERILVDLLEDAPEPSPMAMTGPRRGRLDE